MQRRDFINAGSAMLGAIALGMSATANADNEIKESNNPGLSGSSKMDNRFSVEKMMPFLSLLIYIPAW